jgi:membrane protease YdiL (CAAX protease family)
MNNHNPKELNTTKHSWSAKQAILISVLAFVIAQLFVALAVVGYTLINGQDIQNDDFLNEPWVSLVLTGVSALGILTTILLFFRYKHFKISDLGFVKPCKSDIFKILAVYVGYVLILTAVLGAISYLVPNFNLEQAQDVGFKDALGWQLVLAFIGLVVITPFAEEMLFRGFMYKGIKNHNASKVVLAIGLGLSVIFLILNNIEASLVIATLTMVSNFIYQKNAKIGGAIFVSMLFGMVHMQWNVAIDTFFLSLALVWLVESTGNLWSAIALHALKNFMAFIFVFEIIKI